MKPLSARLSCAICLAALLAVSAGAVGADDVLEIGQWSERTIVYQGSDDVANIRAGMAADPFGGIHLMWYREDDSIMYSRWDGSGWTAPVDILISPNNDRTYRAAFAIDQAGRLHAVWGGSEALYYSHSRYDQAQSAANWSTPTVIGSPSSAYSIVAGGNSLRLVYSAFGEEVYYSSSPDGGATWGPAVQVSESLYGEATNEPRIFYDQNGILHVVWNSIPLPDGYPPAGVFYAQSVDDGATWSPPVQLGGLDMGQPNVAVAGDGTVHVVWNGRVGVGGRYHTWSADGGEAWSDVERITMPPAELAGGLTHPPSLTVDGEGVLHFLFTTNTPGAVYTYWTGDRLVPPQLLVSAAEGDWWNEQASLLAAFGNQLHLIAMGASTRFLWHSWALLDAEAIPPRPTPRYESTPTPTGTARPRPAATATMTPDSLAVSPPNPMVQSGSRELAVFVGIVPALLLVVTVLAYRLARRGSR
jgi:hypothetical protein